MKIKEISIGKEFKVGLPSYSNITTSAYITVEIGEGERVDWDKAWDIVNQQLSIQTGHIDPTWITQKEFGNFFRVTVKAPKQANKEKLINEK